MEAEAAPFVDITSTALRLYTSRECAWLVVYWICTWVVSHYLLWFFWKSGAVSLVPQSTTDRYRRRLCRSQVYCGIASVSGVYLLLQCGWNAFDLLRMFSWKHQILFCMAVAHWLVSIWEDIQCVSFLNAGMSSSQVNQEANVNLFLAKAYLVHHLVAASAFAAVTYLQVCTGMGAFGLLFEVPVLWMNHREFVVCMDPRPAWFCDMQKLSRFWRQLTWAFAVGRLIPTLVYFYSILFWSDDLSKLSGKEYFTYHFMAIFFTILNYGLNGLLGGWKRSDTEHALRISERRGSALGASPRRRMASGGGPDEEEAIDSDEEVVVDGPPTKLKNIPEEEFYKDNGAEYVNGQVWIEIDGIAYEVTGFLAQHPGGEAVLRKYTGRDASEAFHRVRHSMRAKMMMQKYAIGSIKKRQRTYRIFEHHELMADIFMKALISMFNFCILGLLISRNVLGQYLANLPDTTPWGVMLMPGLIQSAGMGAAFSTMTFFSGVGFFPRINFRSSCIGVGLSMMSVGLFLSRRPLSAACPWFTPTGIELAAVGLFAVEDIFELCGSRKHWSWHTLVGAVSIGLGLHLRGVLDLVSLAPNHLLGAGLLVCGTLLVTHSINDVRSQEHTVREVLDGAKFAFVYSGIALYILTQDNAAWEVVTTIYASSWWTLIKSVPATVAAGYAVKRVLEYSFSKSPSWCVRLLANCMGAGYGLLGGFSHYCWLSWVAWFAHNASVAIRFRKRDDDYTALESYQTVPDYIVGTRSLWDTWRAGLCALAWAMFHVPGKALVNLVLPEELAVHSNTLPVFDLGDMVNYGVAAYMAPAQAQHHKEAPSHFECSVQHIDASTDEGALDLHRAGNAIRDRWRELRKDDALGLVANFVCFFPNVEGTELTKEIRIACWQNEEDAIAWREKKSSARRRGQEGIAGLHTAGELQLPLEPQCEIRHQDRCSTCFRLVESEKLGVRAPRRCKACGGKGRGYPFF